MFFFYFRNWHIYVVKPLELSDKFLYVAIRREKLCLTHEISSFPSFTAQPLWFGCRHCVNSLIKVYLKGCFLEFDFKSIKPKSSFLMTTLQLLSNCQATIDIRNLFPPPFCKIQLKLKDALKRHNSRRTTPDMTIIIARTRKSVTQLGKSSSVYACFPLFSVEIFKLAAVLTWSQGSSMAERSFCAQNCFLFIFWLKFN